jgi:hypothetical protein
MFSSTHTSLRALFICLGFRSASRSWRLLTFSWGISKVYENDAAVSDSFLWLRLITQGVGFAFIAFTYYFSTRAERTARHILGMISFASVISIYLFLGTYHSHGVGGESAETW